MENKVKLKIFFYLLNVVVFCVAINIIEFNQASATLSPDVIAIRVLPNEEHYSAQQWYENQGFSGSPQSLTVDGYGAVRDGRTAYVNVANIDDQETATTTDDVFYTNIYLISYNQDAESATEDIFGQILNYWSFNTNITSPDCSINLSFCNNITGSCSISSMTCSSVADCDDGYSCSANKCILDEVENCLTDEDCPDNLFCDNEKSKITRDTRRLEDLALIEDYLEDYYNSYNYYPALDAGTYLPYKTVSTWPSWQDTFASNLGVSLPIDPVNVMGECSNYNVDTCWNDEDKSFVGDVPDRLPEDSLVYSYWRSNLSEYKFCIEMEAGDIFTDFASHYCVPVQEEQ